ncbi:MAG: acylphosphatase, partial [Actinomycetota bacterium]|nr:acylphosphatase [Actinomycetota bacterium]
MTVRGRVQGVGFRDATRREAERLGVAGWVRNAAGGSVELHAEGPAAAVDVIVAWCRQ